MTHQKNGKNNSNNHRADTTVGPPPHDELDRLLRTWHTESAEQAREGRDRLLATLARSSHDEAEAPASTPASAVRPRIARAARSSSGLGFSFAAFGRGPWLRAAASLALMITLIALLIPFPNSRAVAQTIMVPEAGRLDAYGGTGQILGVCPLQHTDVDVAISGRFTRVTLRQEFTNPHPNKIEAVYTFPLSHRAAVDRMQMTIGDRVVVGEVQEREEARKTYEAARQQGYVAGLLEQERPNVFTQSVANIEPGVDVIVEISYVEMVEIVDGVHRFDFPMVVAPRYVPGSPAVSRALVPAELSPRYGLILRGPASFTIGEGGDSSQFGPLHPGKLDALLEAAQPIEFPGTLWWGPAEDGNENQPAPPAIWSPFTAEYADGAREAGVIYTDGTGQVNGRFFYTDPSFIRNMGTGFAPDTDQVPDASRVTPQAVRPPRRAGHDISLSVSLDTGGPAIAEYRSELHAVKEVRGRGVGAHGRRLSIALADRREIPNRDFILEWRVADDEIEESHFAHVRPATEESEDVDGFFTLVLNPPGRVDDAELRARELIFVLDCSGSMEGFPIEKAKAVLKRALDTMRPGDIFNVVTFNNSHEVLWERPRANTEENRAEAHAHVDARQGGGGTEMKNAVLAALRTAPVEVTALDPAALADRAASGQRVEVSARMRDLETAPDESMRLRVREDLAIALDLRVALPSVLQPENASLLLGGYWRTTGGERVFVVDTAEPRHEDEHTRTRFVLFLSDGEVANDDAVIAAVRAEAGRSRMFTVAIGSSPNKSLLDGMAKAGRGVADYITLEGDPDAAVQRFGDRIDRPVLTDIELEFSDGLAVAECIPPVDAVPDLFDERPLVIHGRYAKAGAGTLTIRGNTARGRYERVVPVTLAADASDHDVIAPLWARAKVDELEKAGDTAAIIALGEEFQLMTKHTSFVAVEKSRLTIGGKPMLVSIPVEMPEGQAWHGTFGGGEVEDAFIQALAEDLEESRRWRFASKGPAPRALRRLSDAVEAARPPVPQMQQASQGLPALAKSREDSRERFGELMTRAARQLDESDYDGALQSTLTAQIQLGRDRLLLADSEFAEKAVEAQQRRADIEARREVARTAIDSPSRYSTVTLQPDDASIQQLVTDHLVRVRELQVAGQVEEALAINDEVLFFDQNNAAAVLLQNELEVMRRGQRPELGIAGLEGLDPVVLGGEFKVLTDGAGVKRVSLLGQNAMPERGVQLEQLFAGYRASYGRTDGEAPDDAAGENSQSRDVTLRYHWYGETTPPPPPVPADSFGVVAKMSYANTTAAPQVGLIMNSGAPPTMLSVHDDPSSIVVRFENSMGQVAFDAATADANGVDVAAGRSLPAQTVAAGALRKTLASSADAGIDADVLAAVQLLTTQSPDSTEANAHYKKSLAELNETLDQVTRIDRALADTATAEREDARAQAKANVPALARIPVVDEYFERKAPGSQDAQSVSMRQWESSPARSTLTAEEVILIIAALVDRGSRDEGSTLANALAAGRPDFALGVTVRDVLADDELSDDERRRAVAAAADAAEQRIVAFIEGKRREARARRVLDRGFWPIVFGADGPDELGKFYGGPAPEGATWRDGGVVVTVLVSESTDETVKALEAAGLVIEDRSRSIPLIVGVAPLERLVDIALVEGVRRVEPTKFAGAAIHD